jgi:nucleotide-binding universal stress UspA family protein
MELAQTRILIATDLTERSKRALGRGFLLAKELEASLFVAHVVDEKLPAKSKAKAIDQAAKALSRDMEEAIAATGVEATFEVLVGRPDTEIPKLTGSSDIDLAVLGVDDSFTRQDRTFAETTAGRILLSSQTATLLVKVDPHQSYRQIVVGVDFSVYSRAAIRQALQVAPSANLHLVHAYQLPFQGFLGRADIGGEVAYAERLEFNAFIQEEMDALEKRAERLGALSGYIRKTVEEGDPRVVLRSACARVNAELLVIGTHARTGVSEAVWGSVATDILQNPPCDLLIVRPS